MNRDEPRAIRAWCLYDVANSAFATTVVAAVLPVYFSTVVGQGLDPDPERARVLASSLWGRANTVTMLLTALSAPFLGALADRLGVRKRVLATLAFLGCVFTAGLALVGAGDWRAAAILYVLASLGWSGSLVAYDALLPHVASSGRMDSVSARGFAWGYLGGGLLLALQLAAILRPESFGLPDADSASRLAFLSVAIWWAAFTIPLLREIRETRIPGDAAQVLRGSLAQLANSFRELRAHPNALLFLVAFWIYNDGIGTITRMGVIFGAELNIGRSTLIGAILAVQILGFPFALAFGWLSRRVGPRSAILIGIAGYCMLCVYALFLRNAVHFWILAIGVSMFQGGTQAISRSFFASMIPHERSGEFFGFYNLSSKFAGIIGTTMIATLGPMLGSSRYGVLALIVLFFAGAGLLLRVRTPRRA